MLLRGSCWMNSASLLKMCQSTSSLHWDVCSTKHHQMEYGESMKVGSTYIYEIIQCKDYVCVCGVIG